MSVHNEAYMKKPGKHNAEEFKDADIEILPGSPPKRIIGPAVKTTGPSKSSTITPKSQKQFIIQKNSVAPLTQVWCVSVTFSISSLPHYAISLLESFLKIYFLSGSSKPTKTFISTNALY